MVLGEKVSLMETPLQESSNKTLSLLVCMQLNKQGPRALVRKVIRITFPRTLKHSFPLKTDRSFYRQVRKKAGMLSLSERNLSRSLTKDSAIIVFPRQKKRYFPTIFQPVPPKITLFEIFLSLSLSLSLIL